MNEIKDKIKHFLLQKDKQYVNAIKNNQTPPSMSQIATNLSRKCNVGVRRLRKYLSESPTDLSISLEDLQNFSDLAGQNISSYIAYLYDEKLDSSLNPRQIRLIDFFDRVHLSLRRELNLTIFSDNDVKKSEKILELLPCLYKLQQVDIEVIAHIIEAFRSKSERNK
ncbi:MAG: hypothetical protein AB8G05_09675 [Oligoflexales bacterium]